MNDISKSHRRPVLADDAAGSAQPRLLAQPQEQVLSDRGSAGMRATMTIIARRCPWPGLHERRDRSGLALRWDALNEAGDMLAPATMHPLHDGAFAMLSRGADPEALVTMRHEGAAHDSFTPLPLRTPAALGAKRAEGRARLAEHRAADRPERSALRDRTAIDGLEMVGGEA